MTGLQDSLEAAGPDSAREMMSTIVEDRYGHADVLRFDRVPTPVCGTHDVLVRVAAAGLDRGAWHATTGLLYLGRLFIGVRRPKNPVLGAELAGTVVAVGSAVTEFLVGDEVFGVGRGTFAEYALAADSRLAHKPANLCFKQAAAMPVPGVTALRAAHDKGRVHQGPLVLVTEASGGVGTYAVQIAVAAGAHVTGVCSPAEAEFVRSLGAHDVIDRTHDDFADGTHRHDVINKRFPWLSADRDGRGGRDD